MLNDSIDINSSVENVKGTVTVELFDAKTGKLVDKQKSTNFIANSGKEYFKYLQRVQFRSNLSSLAGSSADTDYARPNPFGYIALTDSTKPTDEANEWRMPGVLIGYSQKSTYSGADTYRGTPNATLCESTDSYTKWVFDWPTHAANGVIGSVHWHNSSGKAFSEPAPEPVLSRSEWTNVQPLGISLGPIAVNNSTEEKFIGTGSGVNVYDSSMVNTANFATIGTSGLAWDSANNKLWVISGDQIASYSATGTLMDGPFSVTSRSYVGLAYDGADLWAAASNNIYQINTTGGDVSSFAVDVSGAAINPSISSAEVRDVAFNSSDGNIYVLLRGRKTYASYPVEASYAASCRIYNSTGSIVEGPFSLYGWYNGNGPSYERNSNFTFDIIDDNNYAMMHYGYDSSRSTYPTGVQYVNIRSAGMGSRFLLPSPITKGSSQTLRITYQMDYI